MAQRAERKALEYSEDSELSTFTLCAMRYALCVNSEACSICQAPKYELLFLYVIGKTCFQTN